MLRLRTELAALLGGLLVAASASPVQALERLALRVPFLQTSITVNLGQARSADELIRSSTDLLELQSASHGAVLGVLQQLFFLPLPLQTRGFLRGSTGQPLLEQALAAVTHFVDFQGVEIDTTGRMLTQALNRAERQGRTHILGFLQELPGEEASLDLSRVVDVANRLKANLEQGVALVDAGPSATVDPSLRATLSGRWSRDVLQFSVPHRTESLKLIVLLPEQPNGRLVVISHGLWDEPESFEGWAEVLAEHGYTVPVPEHPGSDYHRQ